MTDQEYQLIVRAIQDFFKAASRPRSEAPADFEQLIEMLRKFSPDCAQILAQRRKEIIFLQMTSSADGIDRLKQILQECLGTD